MNIVMFSGYLGSGKDVAAEYLVTKYAYKRVAFADVLKDEVACIYNLERKTLDCPVGKQTYVEKHNKTVRQILINHGEARRKINPNYWTDKVIKQIKESKIYNIVISDWRFKNEYEVIKQSFESANVIKVRILRYSISSLQHPSETELENQQFESQICNHGTILDFHHHIEMFVQKIKN